MTSAANYSTVVQELYVTYFGRPADFYGLQNFEAALAAASAPTDVAGLNAAYSSNPAVKSLIDSFGNSHESIALYGSGNTASFVTAVFENLLNRAPAVAGLSFWVNAIDTGTVSMGDAALAIAAGAQANTTDQGKIDALTLANKLSIASSFTTDLSAESASIVAYAGADAAAIARSLLAGVGNTTSLTGYQPSVQAAVSAITLGKSDATFTLTTGIDSFTGGLGNNTFNAILDDTKGVDAGGEAATLNAFDSITGAGQKNTLNINDFGQSGVMNLPPSATITGITTLNINTLEGIGDIEPQDFSTWASLTALNVKTSNGNDNIKVGDNTALSITETKASAAIDTFGGVTVSVTDTNSGDALVYGDSTTTSVSIDGGRSTVIDSHSSIWPGGSTPGTNTITSVSFSDVISESSNIYGDAIASLNLTNDSNGAYIVHSGVGTRALTVNLDNDGNAASGAIYVSDSNATSLTINATNAATNNLNIENFAATTVTFNDAVDVKFFQGTQPGSGDLSLVSVATVHLSGAGDFTGDFSGVNSTAAIDASASSGVITIELASASANGTSQSFVGGSGQDIIMIGAGQTGTVVGGAAHNNEIILNNFGATTEAAVASVSNFAILGIAGTTSGVFDMSKATGYTSFDVQQSGGNVSFTGVAAGSSLSIDQGNSHDITLQSADSTGSTDTASVTIGSAVSTGITVNQLNLEDAASYGTGTVNLDSSGSGAVHANTLATLGDSNLVTLKLSGNQALNISNSIADQSASININNNAGTAGSSITGLTDNALTAINFGGTKQTTLQNITSTTTSLTVTDSDSAAVTISAIDFDTAITTATFTNTVNTKASVLTVGFFPQNQLTTLNLNGNVAMGFMGGMATTGVTVAGSTDNADVQVFSTGATQTGKTDSVILGDGNDNVSLGHGAVGSTQTVVLGNGSSDSIASNSQGTINYTVGGVAGGTDVIINVGSGTIAHISAGNSNNDIAIVGSGDSVNISTGSGTNYITTGNGASGSISIATHTAANTITVGDNGSTGALGNIIAITGLNNAAGDVIRFSDNATVAAGAMQQITEAEVQAAGGDPTNFASWVAAATGAAGSGVTQTANGINWFTFHGSTFLVETAAATDAGVIQAADTIVELVGTNYTFNHASASGGILHLLG